MISTIAVLQAVSMTQRVTSQMGMDPLLAVAVVAVAGRARQERMQCVVWVGLVAVAAQGCNPAAQPGNGCHAHLAD